MSLIEEQRTRRVLRPGRWEHVLSGRSRARDDALDTMVAAVFLLHRGRGFGRCDSGLDKLKRLSARPKASSRKSAKWPGATVERYGEVSLDEAALLTVDASNDASKPFE